MFGDILHGGILFIFGLYILLNAEKIKKQKG
jgi:vacuolar-type H+-ATPase subunit I/STV1